MQSKAEKFAYERSTKLRNRWTTKLSIVSLTERDVMENNCSFVHIFNMYVLVLISSISNIWFLLTPIRFIEVLIKKLVFEYVACSRYVFFRWTYYLSVSRINIYAADRLMAVYTIKYKKYLYHAHLYIYIYLRRCLNIWD